MLFRNIQQLFYYLLKLSMSFKGFAVYGFLIAMFWPLIGEAQSSNTWEQDERFTLYFYNSTNPVQITLAPEDRTAVNHMHWPILFIEWEEGGVKSCQMVNLTEETTLSFNLGTDKKIRIMGENGVWKLVATNQKLIRADLKKATALRYVDLGHNELWRTNTTYTIPTMPNLQTFKINNNGLLKLGLESTNKLDELYASENKLEAAWVQNLSKISFLDLSKNLLKEVSLPTALNTLDRKIFVGGNAEAYANPTQLYVTKGQNDTKINLTVNRLNISTLPTLPRANNSEKPVLPQNYYYTLQERYKLPKDNYGLREQIDLSSQLLATGISGAQKQTTFRWYIEKDAATDKYELLDPSYYQEENGKFTFIRGIGTNRRIFAAMTTEAFPFPLESFERGNAEQSTYTTGFSDVLGQPAGNLSPDKDVYFAHLSTNTLGDGTSRTLNTRFYRTNTITLNYANYWYGYVSNEWANPENWTGKFVPPTLPGEFDNLADKSEADVVFATVANFGSSAIRDLHTDAERKINQYVNHSEKAKVLVVKPGTSLYMEGSANLGGVTEGPYAGQADLAYRTIIKAEAGKPNGTLILDKNISDFKAVVELYAKSSDGNRKKQEASWQYFGVPVLGFSADKLASGTWIRKYNRTKNNDFDEKWEELASATEFLTPKIAYQITQPAPTTHRFYGNLFLDNEVTFSANGETQPVNYNDMNIFANPYTAAMKISEIKFTGAVAKEIYLFNTGSREDWKTNNGHSTFGSSRGQYTHVVPINLVGHLPEMPKEIPSMSAFMVKATGIGSLTYKREDLQNSTTENRNQSRTFPSIMIDVESEETTDKLWIVEAEGTTSGYDSGYDGEKLFVAGAAQLYALQDKNYQVSSDSQIKDTEIGFIPGDEAKNYLLRFRLNEIPEGRQYYLVDHLTGATTPIANGETYRFTANNYDRPNRFALRKKITSTTDEGQLEAFDIRIDKHRTLNILNYGEEHANVEVFDASGKRIVFSSINAQGRHSHTFEAGGIYLIRVSNAQTTLVRRYSLP